MPTTNTTRNINDQAGIEHDLNTHGVALFQGGSTESMTTVFNSLADPIVHRDADADLVTRIKPSHPRAGQPGFDGFTDRGLPPHTDGSGILHPPGVLATVVRIAARVGGETLLVRVDRLVDELHTSGLLDELTTVKVKIGRTPISTPVVKIEHGRYSMRWRDDREIDFSNLRPATIDQLRVAINDLTEQHALRVGEGYVLENDRVLHGRNGFAGYREVHRLVGRPRQTFGTGVAA